ncbi:MAG: HEAT repeat domain-containing protein [Bacteroidota bacterium]
MKCEKDKGEITDYISGQMTDEEKSAFETHLSTCSSCMEELKLQQGVWKMLVQATVPTASAKLDDGFKKMLDELESKEKESKVITMHTAGNSTGMNSIKMLWRIAAAVILVIAGFGAGYLLNRPKSTVVADTYKQQIDSLSAQVHDMREMMMLSLLENPSASERIRAVGYTNEISNVNAKMIEALLTTLNNDPNVNVRLMTLEALTHYAANPAVREGLVQSIVQQESPLVQSALADAMLKMQEKRAVQPFKKLLQQKEINIQVRTKIEQTISRLT